MKKSLHKTFAAAAFAAITALLASCSGLTGGNEEPLSPLSKPNASTPTESPADQNDGTQGEKITSFATGDGISYDKASNTYTCDGSKIASGAWNYFTMDLSKYGGQEATLEFTCTMEVENKGSTSANLMWQITNNGYPVLGSAVFSANTTTQTAISIKKELTIEENKVFYLSTYGTTKENLVIKVTDPVLKISGIEADPALEDLKDLEDWMSVPSLKDAFCKYFDYFGFAVENNQLTNETVQKGLAYHANTITMGNEFKPCSVLGDYSGKVPVVSAKFTSSKGVTIDVPENVPDFTTVDSCLETCKENGLNMRGHVLVWHSQSPACLFRENFDKNKDYVSKEEMDARQEWYIKTVLQHVTEWENENNGGKHIVWAWDVVNEAVSDSANDTAWLRTSSDWYNIYKDESFIVNAFRYANKYAPKDVLLTYNDYNCYMENKNKAICGLIKEIQEASKDEVLPARIDVAGMQTHVIDDFPTPEAFDKAVKNLAALGVDVHVTEFDLANRKEAYSAELNGSLYAQYFSYMIANRKTEENNGITSVTIWGLDDDTSWLISQYANQTTNKQHPLLFLKQNGNYCAKPEFYSILSIAE